MRDPSSWERLIQESPIQPRLPSSDVLSLGIRNQHATGACIYDPQLISVIENDKTQIRSARGWRQSQRYRSGAIGIDDVGALRCSVRNNGAIQTNRSGLLDADIAVELEGMFKAKAAALKALELDDSLAEAHTSLAQISSTYERNWVLAESEYKRALALNANYSTGHHYYATFLMAMGRHDEAMAEMKKAQELDPLSPIIATFIGKALYFAGKNDESIAEYQKVLATDPAFPVARTFLIHSLEQAGRFDEVIAQRTIIAAQFGNSVEHTNALRQRYKSEGVRGYRKSRIAEMGGKLEDKPEAALETASLYARLGDKDRAFSFLERALEYHDLWAEYLKVDAQWENLHGDSRYELALKHAGLN